ncbi:MAG: tetratricopeptide repeat protein, partial [bacterium]|nr:tetratricopeptide repeat protein [bacterium]
HLLVAQRGMGKTMLLRRLHFAVEDDPELAAVWLPLAFPEEQYNVARLSDLWLNSIDALGDALERLGRGAEAERLDSELEALLDIEEERRSRETLALLIATAAGLERRLVLLIDNIDLIFERISEQAWALREILSEEPAILLVGASARALESSYQYDQPFYDFFHIHELGGLSLGETADLLRQYAERWGNEEVLRVVREEPARIRTLHTLTGGNPRTLALLYNILGRGLDGDVRSDLEALLDQCTPLYKARLEALAPQRQRVVHALAVHWHPASAAAVAGELRLDVKAVSSQLTRLVREGVVEAVPFDPASKNGFQLAERFFNIWYLMRATRRARRRLIWLVEFLKMFYSQEQLRSHALEHLAREFRLPPQERLRFAEYSFALAEVFHESPFRRALETSGLYALIEDKALRGRLAELVDLEDEEAELRPWAEHKERIEKLREAVFAAKPAVEDWSAERFWDALSHSVQPLEQKKHMVAELAEVTPQKLGKIQADFDKEAAFIAELVGSERVAEALREAFARGWMMSPHDVEGARTAAIRLEEPGLEVFSLARSLDTAKDRRPLLEELGPHLETTDSPAVLALWAKHTAGLDPESSRLREVLESLRPHEIHSPLVLLDLAVARLRIDCPKESAECVDRARKLGIEEVPLSWLSYVAVAWVLAGRELGSRGRRREGKAAIETATQISRTTVELSPENAVSWLLLGASLGDQGRRDQAVEAFRKSVELSPENAVSWQFLGTALFNHGRFDQAEEASRKAVELSPEDAVAWQFLGAALVGQGRLDQAEEAVRKAVELSPENAVAWRLLGTALVGQGRLDQAEEAFRKSVELSPENVVVWQLLSTLARNGKWTEAFEQAGRLAADGSEKFHGRNLPEIFSFVREAVSAGKAREAADLLDRLGMADRWQPLREALETVAVGRRSYLRRLAPEVRQATEEILKQLEENQATAQVPGDAPAK